jgi:3-methyladenine DNA glycosylase/8-oxoguanine DNA glycosylase
VRPTDPSLEQAREYRPGHLLDLGATLSSLRAGPPDPSWRREPDGTHWWTTRTPQGLGLLRLHPRPALGLVEASAWGEGAVWLLDGVPDLLGHDDRPQDFRPLPAHPVLVRAWRSRPGWRVPRSRRVLDTFAFACVGQRVTGQEAFLGWRMLLLAHGEPAPGAPARPGGPAHGMRAAPAGAGWRRIPSWEWLRAGVDQHRRAPLLAGAGAPHGLERTLGLAPAEADRVLQTLPGVGRWTSAEVRQRAHGDPDAMSFGDFHVARNVSFALTGVVMDDDACAEVVACYAGHRYRVQRLLELAGIRRPRRAPRMTLPSHTPARFLRGGRPRAQRE